MRATLYSLRPNVVVSDAVDFLNHPKLLHGCQTPGEILRLLEELPALLPILRKLYLISQEVWETPDPRNKDGTVSGAERAVKDRRLELEKLEERYCEYVESRIHTLQFFGAYTTATLLEHPLFRRPDGCNASKITTIIDGLQDTFPFLDCLRCLVGPDPAAVGTERDLERIQELLVWNEFVGNPSKDQRLFLTLWPGKFSN